MVWGGQGRGSGWRQLEVLKGGGHAYGGMAKGFNHYRRSNVRKREKEGLFGVKLEGRGAWERKD